MQIFLQIKHIHYFTTIKGIELQKKKRNTCTYSQSNVTQDGSSVTPFKTRIEYKLKTFLKT